MSSTAVEMPTTTQLGKMSIDLKFVELMADDLEIYLSKYPISGSIIFLRVYLNCCLYMLLVLVLELGDRNVG